jgi:hypothetical protein
MYVLNKENSSDIWGINKLLNGLRSNKLTAYFFFTIESENKTDNV